MEGKFILIVLGPSEIEMMRIEATPEILSAALRGIANAIAPPIHIVRAKPMPPPSPPAVEGVLI